MNLSERTDALLALVRQHCNDRCAALLQPADDEARALLRAALSDGRRRVRTAIAEERKRLRSAVGAREAALQTERRIASQRHEAQLLARAWHELPRVLTDRWNDAHRRTRWVDAHLARACATFECSVQWRIRHHPAWSEQERSAAAARLAARGIAAAFEEDPGIGAGLTIACGHNVLDASLDGLLADRALIEGRLLQLLSEDRQ
jgi:hypothetical protein